MENFTRFIPTHLHFGEGVIQKLGKAVKTYGQNVLLLYGKGSIKENGIYQDVTNQLIAANCNIIEYSGIKPNPVIEDVDAAVGVARKEKIDVIVAVGGGSVIDTAKVVSVALHYEGPAWDVVSGEVRAKKAYPVIAVLTLAATGTEMNAFAVVQNHSTNQKVGYGAPPHTYPKDSFLDPSYTISVSKEQTTNGIVDLIAHSLEAYFGEGEASLADRFVFEIIKEAIEHGPNLLDDPTNYELRAKIMLAATMALNGITSLGRKGGDWGVHSIGHTLSMLYDISHGASLSIAYPAWLHFHKEKAGDRILLLSKNLFNVTSIDEGINKIENFFKSIKSPVSISELKIETLDFNEILNTMNKNKVSGSHHALDDKDREAILKLMW